MKNSLTLLILHFFLISCFSDINRTDLKLNINIENSYNNNTNYMKIYDYSDLKRSFSLLDQNLTFPIVNNTLNMDSLLCMQYAISNYSIKECILQIIYNNDSVFSFRLYSANNTNTAYQKFLVSSDDSLEDFSVYPLFLQEFFSLKSCYNIDCDNTTSLNLVEYNKAQYFFKLNINKEIASFYKIYLKEALVLVKDSDLKVEYLESVKGIMNQNNNVTVINMDPLPDTFDLHLIYSVSKTNSSSASNLNLNEGDVITLVKRNINSPMVFQLSNNPNSDLLLISFSISFSFIAVSLLVIIFKKYFQKYFKKKII